jgi:hypothetical protein
MHQANPLTFDPDWGISVIGLFIIAALIGLVLGMIARKQWKAICFVLTMFTILVFFLSDDVELIVTQTAQVSRPVDIRTSAPLAYTHANAQVAGATVDSMPNGSGVAVAQTDPTLEALWNKLTESKIQIEPDPDYTPDLSKEETRKRVAKEQGTKPNGDMPPNWVLSPNKVIGGVYRRKVASDPFVTEAECRRQLEDELLPEVVKNRLEQLLPSKVHRKVQIDDLAQYGIGLDFILREICVDEFTATVDTSVGPMKKVHVLMEFNTWVDGAMVSMWKRHESDMRLARFAKIAGLTLTGLAAAWSLLRFDTYSRGYYSKQLLGGSVLAIIALAVFFLRT